MRKTLILLGVLALTPQLKAQLLLEALDAPDFDKCYSIPSSHPFHKVTRENYKFENALINHISRSDSAYMWWYEAVRYKFPDGYHLPSRAEWRTIVPENEVWNIGNNNTKLNVVESHQFGKAGISTTTYKTFKGDYYKANDGTLYGIRFKPSDQSIGNFTPNHNNDFTTAYRYRDLGDRIVVDIHYIGATKIDITEISNPNYWEGTTCRDAFVFIKEGYFFDHNDYHDEGSWFWTSDSVKNGVGVWWTDKGGFQHGQSSDRYDGEYMDNIRLFKD